MSDTQQWQARTEDSATIIVMNDTVVTAELVCDITQRRDLRLCRIEDYFTEIGRDGYDTICAYVEQSFDAATQAEIAAAVRARMDKRSSAPA